jgi:hypothetical protein
MNIVLQNLHVECEMIHVLYVNNILFIFPYQRLTNIGPMSKMTLDQRCKMTLGQHNYYVGLTLVQHSHVIWDLQTVCFFKV